MTTWAVAPSEPTPDVVAAVEAAVGARATSWRKPHTGITPAQRFAVTFADGTSAFVKAAVDEMTHAALATERGALESIADDFVPRLLNATSDLLITEDLSAAYWPADHPGPAGPVTWLPGQIDALLATLDRVATTRLDAAPLGRDRELYWPRIAADPDAFAVPRRDSIESLMAAEAAIDFDGDALVHNDVRSDNVCFVGDRVVLVDWSSIRRGNALHDRAALALTVAIEGGPAPYEIVDDAPYAAWLSGQMLTKAADLRGQAPAWLIGVFERCSVVALDWAAKCLNLSA